MLLQFTPSIPFTPSTDKLIIIFIVDCCKCGNYLFRSNYMQEIPSWHCRRLRIFNKTFFCLTA